MGRFRGIPEGYRPALRLWLRQASEGGGLPASGELRPEGVARREGLVLVHGYNNHEGDAAAYYLGFRERQYHNFRDLPQGKLEETLCDSFWPGDTNWSGPLDRLDFLYYSAAVGVAVRAADVLEQLIARMPAVERVDFIAHSLGCRLALETIRLMRERGYPQVGRVCLMAAAVPSEMLEQPGPLHGLMLALQRDAVPVLVLHSKHDSVLRFAFPPGQTLAGEGFLPAALGLTGPRPWLPGFGANVRGARIDKAGHGDYWATDAAAREAGGFLGLGRNLRRIEAREPAAEREVGWTRNIGADTALAPA